ncbi:FAD binding domain-containing protein [Nocardia asteroides]|nr:FAD binding domain-containing protein [Nocardia asteroides]
MAPPALRYHAPTTVTEAVDVLAALGDDAAILAGGQSLMPLLITRQLTPGHVVDINGIASLDYVRLEPAGVRLGAVARQADVEHDRQVIGVLPLLRQALCLVAVPAVRSRGTIVGSLVGGLPSAELRAALALAGGSVQVAGVEGTRTVPAEVFLADGVGARDLVVSALIRRPPPGTGTAVVEVSRRRRVGRAIVGVAAAVTLTAQRRIDRARVAYMGIAVTPPTLDLTETAIDSDATRVEWIAAGRRAREQIHPVGDRYATAAYRRHLVDVLTTRALRAATAHALAEPNDAR